MTYDQLKADVDFLVDTDSTTYPVADKTRNFNFALDEITGVIIGCDGTWQFDDTNYTDLPIGTTDLNSNQQDYTFDNDHLYIEDIEIKNQEGKWKRLKPIDLYTDTQETSITDYKNTTGEPEYYDKAGSTIFLYPAPSYTQEQSLRAFFQRKIEHFTEADTTKEAGFAPHLHRYLSVSVAYDWAIAKQHTKQNFLLNEKNRYIELIKKFYSKREKDVRPRLNVIYQDNK